VSARVGGRVLRLEAPQDLRVVELPHPDAGAGEVAVDVRAVGVCGTDLHAYRGRAQRLPIVLGHDVAGLVTGVGAGVDEALLARRVTIDPAMRCGRCVYCARGLPALCPVGAYMGMSVDGAFAERLVVPAANVHVLPDAVDDLAATVLEPVVVALRLLQRTDGVLPDPARTVVIGGGPLGIVLARVLQARGHDVRVVEPQPGRRRVAEGLGLSAVAPEVLPPPPAGPALLVETSATAAGTLLALQAATPGSAIAVIGRSPESVPMADVLLGELSVLGVRGGSGLYDDAIRLVADGVVAPAAVITHQYAADQAGAAFAEAVASPDNVLRAVVHLTPTAAEELR